MITSNLLFLLFLATITPSPTSTFTTTPTLNTFLQPHSKRIQTRTHLSGRGFAETPSDDQPPEDDLSAKFNAFLRDLQIEEVPILECDVKDLPSFSAALWTFLSEISEADFEQKICIVFETVGMDVLNEFVRDFSMLKQQSRLMQCLPELERVDVSVLGKGAGPALVLETSERNDDEFEEKRRRRMEAAKGNVDEKNCIAALESFVARMVIGVVADTGTDARGPLEYRFSPTVDACSAMATFWTCICELQFRPETELSALFLSLPGIGAGRDRTAHDRFAAVTELMSRYLCLFREDSNFALVHFHPAYDRDLIHPIDKDVHGHLPPREWLRPMMLSQINEGEAAAENLTDEELSLSDFQRRSPHTAIQILRVGDANERKNVVDLDLGDGRIEKASGVNIYAQNAIRLAKVGKEELERKLEEEIRMGSDGQ